MAQQTITVNQTMLLQVIGLVEWSVARGQMTYEQALAVVHATANEAITDAQSSDAAMPLHRMS